FDEETFRTPPFDGTPTVTWTRELAPVLSALIDGGAKVVGFDIVFPTSIEQSAVPFDDAGDTLGARLRGFDRDFLRALALGARASAPARQGWGWAGGSTGTSRCCRRPASAPRSASAATSAPSTC